VLEESEETRSNEPMSDAALLQWLEKMLFNDPRRPLALGGSLQTSELNSALVQRIATVVETSYTAREADYLRIEVDHRRRRAASCSQTSLACRCRRRWTRATSASACTPTSSTRGRGWRSS
jgi:hypothetical protein